MKKKMLWGFVPLSFTLLLSKQSVNINQISVIGLYPAVHLVLESFDDKIRLSQSRLTIENYDHGHDRALILGR